MTETQKKFSNIINELVDIEKEACVNSKRTSDIADAIENMNCLVPVVGEFSAGKSTLLNLLIGKKILATAINPETAIPAELYYSENEYDIGVTENGTEEKLSGIDKDTAKRYSYVKRYVNSEFLKQIQPIVLVDMPGFDSPLDEHNKSIYSYLDKGCHYIILVPADAGTVSRSMQRQIKNIQSFKRDCTVFISKTDLKSENEIEEIKSHIEDELDGLFDDRKIVYPINHEDARNFDNFITTVTPDEIFQDVFYGQISDELYSAKESINIKIAALKNDDKKNQAAIDELKSALHSLETKKQRMIENAQQKSYGEEANEVSNAVGRAINSEIDNLVNIAMNGDNDSLNAEINNIVNTEITSKLQNVSEKMHTNLCNEFSIGLEKLNSTMLEIFSSPDYIQKICATAHGYFDAGKASISNYIAERNRKTAAAEKTKVAYKTLTGVLAIATDFLLPALELVIVFLPDIIDMIVSGFRQKQERESIRNSIIANIPKIKREVSNSVVKVLKENSGKMIEQIAQQFDEELSQKEAEIEQAQQMGSEQSNEAEIKKLESCSDKVNALLEKLSA